MKPVPPRMSTRMAQSYRGWSVHQPTWRRHSCLPCRRLVSTLLADVTPCRTKSVPMSGDAAGRSACATDYPIDASEKCGLMPRLVAGGFVAADDEVGEAEPCAFGAFQFAVEGDVLGFLHAYAGSMGARLSVDASPSLIPASASLAQFRVRENSKGNTKCPIRNQPRRSPSIPSVPRSGATPGKGSV